MPSGEIDFDFDFDFGDEGEIDGFDEWRLSWFSRDRLAPFGFRSEDELQQVYAAAVRSGSIHQRRQHGLFYVCG